MSFAIHGRNLPTIRSFTNCERHANEWRAQLTPRREQRTWGYGCLPLVAWRDADKRMEWVEDGVDSRWALKYHRTEVVGYFKDGRVLLDATWDSQSTRLFFDNLSPLGVWTHRHGKHGYAYAIGHGRDDSEQEYHKVNRDLDGKWNQAMIINECGNVLNPQPWTITKSLADRERRKEILAKLAPFLTWYDAMTSVGNSMAGVCAGYDGRNNVDAERHVIDALMKGNTDDALWPAACVWLVRVNSSAIFWQHRGNDDTPACIVPVRRAFIEIAYRDYGGYKTVKVTAPAGQLP